MIELESLRGSVNGDGNGDFSEGKVKLFLALGDNLEDIGGFEEASFLLAGSFDSNVFVVSRGSESIESGIFEGIVDGSSITSLISLFVRAVNQLLFREGDNFLRLLPVKGFERSGGSKSPSSFARKLVLDGTDGSGFSPVDVVFGFSGELFGFVGGLGLRSAQVNVLKFFDGEVHVGVGLHVESHLSGGEFFIMVVNEDDVLFEIIKLNVFDVMTIIFSVFILIVFPRIVKS